MICLRLLPQKTHGSDCDGQRLNQRSHFTRDLRRHVHQQIRGIDEVRSGEAIVMRARRKSLLGAIAIPSSPFVLADVAPFILCARIKDFAAPQRVQSNNVAFGYRSVGFQRVPVIPDRRAGLQNLCAGLMRQANLAWFSSLFIFGPEPAHFVGAAYGCSDDLQKNVVFRQL